MKTVATHHSGFHADDVFSIAALSLLLNGDYKLIRTRDPEIIAKSDYVVDVDWVYDPEANRFDHHQKGGAGERANGIPYAGFGLVWKHYGEKITGNKEVAEMVDKVLVQPIDAKDNGVAVCSPVFDGIKDFSMSHIISTYLPTWKEDSSKMDEQFDKAVEFAKGILLRQIEIAKQNVEAIEIIKSIYDESENKEILVFDESVPGFGRKLITQALLKYEDVMYFVHYREEPDAWQVVATNKNGSSYDLRKPLPESWRGTLDEDMAEASGVKDAYVCHRRGFMCIAKSKEGALLLAKKALEA